MIIDDERIRIIAGMSPVELAKFIALGGTVPRGIPRRAWLLERAREVTDAWVTEAWTPPAGRSYTRRREVA